MTTEIAEPGPPPPPAAAGPRKNVFQRIAGVLFAPVDTFADIARRPDILGPLLVILVISYITTGLSMPRIDFDSIREQQAEAMRKQNPNVSDADLERMGKIASASITVFAWIAPLMIIVGQVIMAGILLLAFRLFGGTGDFKQAFSATLYSWFPRVVQGIIGTIVIYARGRVDIAEMATMLKSSPAFLVDMKKQPVLFSLLSNFDLFALWSLVLLILGFSAVSKTSKGKSAAVVISIWLAWVLVKVGFAALGAGMQR